MCLELRVKIPDDVSDFVLVSLFLTSNRSVSFNDFDRVNNGSVDEL